MKLLVFVILIVGALLGGAGHVAYKVHDYANTTVPNSYAVWWVGDLVVGHLQQHDDQWPQSWNDLRPIYDEQIAELGQTWTFDELKSRVVVRWDVDVEATRQLPEPPSDLIFLRDGGKEHWAGEEPNEKVHRYLTQP